MRILTNIPRQTYLRPCSRVYKALLLQHVRVVIVSTTTVRFYPLCGNLKHTVMSNVRVCAGSKLEVNRCTCPSYRIQIVCTRTRCAIDLLGGEIIVQVPTGGWSQIIVSIRWEPGANTHKSEEPVSIDATCFWGGVPKVNSTMYWITVLSRDPETYLPCPTSLIFLVEFLATLRLTGRATNPASATARMIRRFIWDLDKLYSTLCTLYWGYVPGVLDLIQARHYYVNYYANNDYWCQNRVCVRAKWVAVVMCSTLVSGATTAHQLDKST